MTPFEMVFSLFGLLLGFSLVEVLGGFARAVEAVLRPAKNEAERVRVGWLTPLLGLFMMLDLTSFWGGAWFVREYFEVSPISLMSALFFAGSYYLAAHLIFPARTEPGTDLDEHYFQVRRYVISMLLALGLIQWTAVMIVVPAIRAWDLGDFIYNGVAQITVLLIVLLFVRSKAANLVVLVLLCLCYIALMFY